MAQEKELFASNLKMLKDEMDFISLKNVLKYTASQGDREFLSDTLGPLNLKEKELSNPDILLNYLLSTLTAIKHFDGITLGPHLSSLEPNLKVLHELTPRNPSYPSAVEMLKRKLIHENVKDFAVEIVQLRLDIASHDSPLSLLQVDSTRPKTSCSGKDT